MNLGIYEASCLNILLKRQPLNLYDERSGDGQCIAVEKLIELGWVQEDAYGLHTLIKSEQECKSIIDYWFN